MTRCLKLNVVVVSVYSEPTLSIHLMFHYQISTLNWCNHSFDNITNKI